ncbi:unnamed protein product [Linum tenue]|uniref:RING-type E3 ubiquitin transferase n=1 Tax=Linum tenue TaxID=586396 RepID=A0AAV0K749_9ROSI|nr:unnamed protein product [Linum tenue]CAI0417923.1 unnamed protein product [Linum tenue]
MKAPIFLLLFHFSISSPFFPTSHSSSQPTCPPLKCSPQSPEIHTPFHLTAHHPPGCGKPGFTLSCKHNTTTTITFPHHHLDLVVKSISYDENRIDLSDPRRCVHGVFLDLDLSLTPFQYAYAVKEFDYLNCSARLPTGSFDEVACLSGKEHHVYTVEAGERSSFEVLPEFCRVVKSVKIPFGYSPYLADDEFGLGLTWETECGEEMSKGFLANNLVGSALCDKLLKLGLCLVAVALLLSLKMYHTNRGEEMLVNERSHLFFLVESLKGRGDEESSA